MDIIEDILDTVDLKGTLYFRTNFSAPWSVEVPKHSQAARFHLALQGRSYFYIPGHNIIELNAGDLILIPYGASHIIADSPQKQAPTLETVLKDANYNGEHTLVVGKKDDNASTQLMCGHFDFRKKSEHPFLQALPSHIIITSSIRAKNPLLDESIRLISRQAFSQSAGSNAAIKRLSEIIFIELLRLGIDQQSGIEPLFKALKDTKITHSLHIIHTNPTAPWTLESLASEVAMSRSRFAERFKSLMGISPMLYLSEWRLQKALALIGDTTQPIQQVATQTGYKSPSSFTRAFQDKFGMAPKEYRESIL